MNAHADGNQRILRNVRPAPRMNAKSALVTFVNRCSCVVKMYTLDYKGQKEFYNKIGPKEYLDVSSYMNRFWVFESELTGDRLLAGSNLVFHPSLNFSDLKGSLDRRRIVPIQYPLLPLKDLALQAVRDILTSIEEVEKLELPESLKEDLQLLVERKLCAIEHKLCCP